MELKTRFADILGSRIAYYDLGDINSPVILMGHSFLWDKDMWRKQFGPLTKQYRLIVPDLWAHGESEVLSDASININTMSKFYFQFMKELSIDQFAIVGLSVAGMWGTQLALDYPDHVTALVLMGTFVGSEPKESQNAYMALLNNFKERHGFDESLIEQTWHYFYSSRLPKDSPLIDEMKNRLRNIAPDKVDAIYEMGVAIFKRSSNLEYLNQLKMPLAIISGKDDIARTPLESEIMAKAAGTEELFYIEGAGHISCLEKPEMLNLYLLNFFESINVGMS